MNKKEALSHLWECNMKLNRIGHMEELISFDRETAAPLKSGEEMAEMKELLSALYYETATEDRIKEAVSICEEKDFELDKEKAMVRFFKDYYEKEAKLGKDFVKAWALNSALSESKWLEAREKNDFSVFSPYLETLVKLSREKAEILDSSKPAYDVLLDLYEKGMGTGKIDPMFEKLVSVIHHISDKTKTIEVDDSFLRADYDKEKLHEFCTSLSAELGFDPSRGIIRESAHPFSTSVGRDDIRLTTRYTDPSLFDPISSLVHETGHSVYEQHATLNEEIRYTTLASGVSMGIHESQSRLYENFLAKSKAFWHYKYPSLVKAVPHLKDVSLESFYDAINKVWVSPIRVNADEVTYSLHIVLRYELEKKLIGGELEVKDLPDAWREMSRYILSYTPKDDKEGPLQDSHWAGGAFGYFPTYVIGNFYGAMFLSEMKKTVNVDECLKNGRYSDIIFWLDRNIWTHGCLYEPEDLLNRVTGKKLSPDAFCEYLISKFLKEEK